MAIRSSLFGIFSTNAVSLPAGLTIVIFSFLFMDFLKFFTHKKTRFRRGLRLQITKGLPRLKRGGDDLLSLTSAYIHPFHDLTTYLYGLW